MLSRPAAPMPVAVSKRRLRLNLDTELSLRPLVLRSLRTRSVFKVQEGISRAFREYLTAQGFTEIHTPRSSTPGPRGAATSSGWTTSGARHFSPSPPVL